jgi:cysteine desulfurase family protein
MVKRTYLDNSATSFPKPPEVTEAMVRFARQCGASAGRGAYAEARACGEMIATCRQRIARLINAESPDCIVFALNCTEALAIGIRGLLNTAGPSAHAVATVMDHNSVLRPLDALGRQTGLETTFVAADPRTGLVDASDLGRALCPRTKLLVLVHVSNVTGAIQPVAQAAGMARAAGVPCLVDAAQSVGHVPIDVQAWGADMVAFSGHKGALGPLGTGVLYVRPGFQRRLRTMKEGGTGTVSEQPVQPEGMPDKYEIGSHNAIGLAGLSEGVAWLLERTVQRLRQHDRRLCQAFLEALAGAEGIRVYGPADLELRSGVFSVNVAGLGAADLADQLERQHGILTRAGVHCAPLAHQVLGTLPGGTCRLSFGPFTTVEDVVLAASALRQIAEQCRRRPPVAPAGAGPHETSGRSGR